MDHVAKKARLREIRRQVPQYVSQRALASVLNSVEAGDVGQKFNRDQIRAARDSDMKIKTPFGTLHQEIRMDDIGVKFEIQHPLAMMHHLASTSSAFANLLHTRAAAQRPTVERPWKVVIYLDEVCQGTHLRISPPGSHGCFTGPFWIGGPRH